MSRPAGSRVPSPTSGQGPGGWRRALVLLLWVAALVAGAAVVARTPFSADLSAFLPANPDARQRVLIEQLQSGVASRTLMAAVEGGTGAAQRADVSRGSYRFPCAPRLPVITVETLCSVAGPCAFQLLGGKGLTAGFPSSCGFVR